MDTLCVRRITFLVLSALAMSTPVSGHAQVCAGLPSLRERPMIVSAEGLSAEDAWSAGVGVTAGRDVFAAVWGARVTYQDVDFAATRSDAHSWVFDGGVGVEVPLVRESATAGARVGLCPIVTGEWETGPDGDFGGSRLDSDGWTVGGGVSIGAVAVHSANWRVIPFAGASFARVSATVHDYPFVGTDTEAHDTGWLLAFGVGVVVGSRVTLKPTLTIPAAFEGAERTIGVSANVGLGH